MNDRRRAASMQILKSYKNRGILVEVTESVIETMLIPCATSTAIPSLSSQLKTVELFSAQDEIQKPNRIIGVTSRRIYKATLRV